MTHRKAYVFCPWILIKNWSNCSPHLYYGRNPASHGELSYSIFSPPLRFADTDIRFQFHVCDGNESHTCKSKDHPLHYSLSHTLKSPPWKAALSSRAYHHREEYMYRYFQGDDRIRAVLQPPPILYTYLIRNAIDDDWGSSWSKSHINENPPDRFGYSWVLPRVILTC